MWTEIASCAPRQRFDGILPLYRPSAERRLVPTEDFDPGPAVTDPNVALSLLMVGDLLPGNPFSLVAPRCFRNQVLVTAA